MDQIKLPPVIDVYPPGCICPFMQPQVVAAPVSMTSFSSQQGFVRLWPGCATTKCPAYLPPVAPSHAVCRRGEFALPMTAPLGGPNDGE